MSINYRNLSTFIGVILTIIYFVNYNVIEGDPTVYFPFLEHMFSVPFSFGQEGRISFGATSPFMAYLLSVCYFIAPNLDVMIILVKVILYILSVYSIYFIVKIIAILEPNEFKIHADKVLFLTLLMYLLFSNLFFHTIFVLETPIILFYVSLLFLLYYSNKNIYLLLISSFAYLIRPELILIQIVLVSLVLYKNKLSIKYLFLMIYQIIPTFIYHTYMYVYTDNLIPTSIKSRLGRTMQSEYFKDLISMILNHYTFYLPILLMLVIIFYCYYKIKDVTVTKKEIPIIIFIIIGIFLVLKSPSIPTRYIDFAMPLVIITGVLSIIRLSIINKYEDFLENVLNIKYIILFSAVFGLITISHFYYVNLLFLKLLSVSLLFMIVLIILRDIIILKKNFNIIINMAIFSLLITFLFTGPFSFKSNLEIRLDKTLSNQLSNIVKPDDTILLYEVELQYYIDNKVLSFDGIVGSGEFMDFYQGKENLEDAIKKHSVDYIGIDSHSIALPMQRSKLFMKLFKNRFDLNIGDRIIYKDLIFTKVLENNSTNDYKMWEVIYHINSYKGSK